MTEAINAIERANHNYSDEIEKGDNDAIEIHRQEIDEQLKVLRHCMARTNSRGRSFFGSLTTRRSLMFERKFEKSSLFEKILSTAGMKEVIELAFEMCDTLKNEYILQMVSLVIFNDCNQYEKWKC